MEEYDYFLAEPLCNLTMLLVWYYLSDLCLLLFLHLKKVILVLKVEPQLL